MPFDPLYAAPFFVYGLALGSFLNVCIYRLPREMSVVGAEEPTPRQAGGPEWVTWRRLG